MPKAVKTRKVLNVLKRLGFKEIRQKGSHIFFEHDDGRTTLVPLHNEIRAKLLSKIIKDTKTEKEKFLKLLK